MTTKGAGRAAPGLGPPAPAIRRDAGGGTRAPRPPPLSLLLPAGGAPGRRPGARRWAGVHQSRLLCLLACRPPRRGSAPCCCCRQEARCCCGWGGRPSGGGVLVVVRACGWWVASFRPRRRTPRLPPAPAGQRTNRRSGRRVQGGSPPPQMRSAMLEGSSCGAGVEWRGWGGVGWRTGALQSQSSTSSRPGADHRPSEQLAPPSWALPGMRPTSITVL